jgi:hypothetical protein
MSEGNVCKPSYKLRDGRKGTRMADNSAYLWHHATALRNMIQGSRGGGANRAVWPWFAEIQR